MATFNSNIIGKFFLIHLYILLISLKVTFTGEFIGLKKLSLCDDYFVILDSGLYLYDINGLNLVTIYEFKNEYQSSNNKINLTELHYNENAYIFCLINEYLFIYNESSYQIYNFEIERIKTLSSNYYNLIPYKIENNIVRFFIVFNEGTNIGDLYYNFNLNEGIKGTTMVAFDDYDITNKMIRCQANSDLTFIFCFYYSTSNGNNDLVLSSFIIKDTCLEKEQTKTINYNGDLKEIKQIKIAVSNNNKFFVCILEDDGNNKGTPICFINNENNLYEFNEMDCKENSGWADNYQVFYFSETNDFMLLSHYSLDTTIINNYDNAKKLCKGNLENMSGNQEKEYSIIYNNDYQLINYNNFENMEFIDLSAFKKIKQSEYIEKTKNFIETAKDKEELITKLNEFIENKINLNYIDENQELIIQKDDMTIAFTSTNIQKINENSNSTTINLGKAENHLKFIYNISEEDNLYILKIDIEQKYKNYPLIEYEVFYPLDNGKIEILNLSSCEGMDIEISIPIKINDTVDKYNPKSNYYNDICSKATSKNNTDITLKDRRKEFIKNKMSLCEKNCEFISYENKRAKCSCKVKTILSLVNIELDSKNLINNFLDIKKITNIEIVKCYKIVFHMNNIPHNYGFFIITFIFILYCICINVFYCKSLKNLIDEINKIIKTIKDKSNQVTKKEPIKNITKNKRKNLKKKKIKNSSTLNIIKKSKRITTLEENIQNKDNNKIREKSKNILEYTDSELNSLSYKEAIRQDKRSYIQYYCSLLRKKHSILFSFYPNKDYNSRIIKSFLFFFFFTSDLAINALFFTDDTMHKIYNDSGSFNLNYQLPKIIYSCLISGVINFIIKYLSLSEGSIILIKSNKNKNSNFNKKIISKIKIKFCIFFIITFILLLIFGYYISCFCCIYQNTQIHLIKNSLISFGISLILPFFINLLPGIFRIPSLSNKKEKKLCMYKLSRIIEFI